METTQVQAPPLRDARGAYQVVAAGHPLQVFVESPPYLATLRADILAAQRRIWIETYIFADDRAGRDVCAALTERARAGVDVRVLYDAVGSLTTSGRLFNDLIAAGGQVIAYHSFWDVFTRTGAWRLVNRRDHRKLVVVDDQIGYFGGMNIVDVAADHPLASPDAGWRDVHIRLAGPEQAALVESFDRAWARAHHRRVPRRSRDYRRAVLSQGSESIHFFDSGPGARNTRAARVFRRLVARATREIWISMAYFLPPGYVLRPLLRARKQGVAVSVVIPQQSDVRLVQWATQHLTPRLLRRGFRVFERRDRMLHSKVMVVDDQWSVVGSANLDARSLWYNFELVVVIRSTSLASLLRQICETEISQSVALTAESVRARKWWQRWRALVAYWARNVL